MENQVVPAVKLNNGVEIPCIGYGVAMLESGLEEVISNALREGFRFFDNAPAYGNEAPVGRALRQCGIARESLFISTKLPDDCHAYEDALKAFERSKNAMEIDYLDMYLIHFPMPKQGKFCEAWKALERLYKDGLVRVIGLSNFREEHIQKILDMCEIAPATNELECNPYYTIEPLRRFCASAGIHVISWFPLGGPKEPRIPYPTEDYKVLLEDETLNAVGARYGKTAAQIALRWALDSNIIPIPKSARLDRIRENLQIFDFCLTPEEIVLLDNLNHDRKLGPGPNSDYED